MKKKFNIRDVAIGHVSVNNLLTHKLTTIDTNQYKMGKLAAYKLIDRISGIKLKQRNFDVGTSIINGLLL